MEDKDFFPEGNRPLPILGFDRSLRKRYPKFLAQISEPNPYFTIATLLVPGATPGRPLLQVGLQKTFDRQLPGQWVIFLFGQHKKSAISNQPSAFS
jgi:hypothetical protein